MDIINVILTVLAVIVYFWVIAFIAESKGYKKLYWMIAGLFLPGLALFVVIFAHHKDGNQIS